MKTWAKDKAIQQIRLENHKFVGNSRDYND